MLLIPDCLQVFFFGQNPLKGKTREEERGSAETPRFVLDGISKTHPDGAHNHPSGILNHRKHK